MPSHTVHSALVQMYWDDNGAPWQFSRWKEITGIHHGLFPDDGALLPYGWSRKTADLIASYFDQYKNLGSEEEKIKFSSGTKNASQVPGRALWKKWVTDMWRLWKIHARITEILVQENLHPLTIALSSRSGSLEWPKATTYVPMAVDPVGRMLFGVDCLNNYSRVFDELRTTISGLIVRTWINVNNQTKRSKIRIVKLEQEAIEAFKNLDTDKPTKAKIKLVIFKVARWKALADVLHSSENLEKMEDMEASLMTLMVALGAKLEVKASKSGRKYTKVTVTALESLASKEDVADVINFYTEFFTSPVSADSVDLREQQPVVPFRFGIPVNGADPGVEVECNLSPEVLAANMGFDRDGLPLLFNRYRHRAGLSAWDVANADLFKPAQAKANPQMDPIVLHAHQLAGVHAAMRMNFKPIPVSCTCHGCLVADEVGLGKTYQSCTCIAMLTDIVTRQEIGAPLPPIIQSNPYLGESKVILDLPHLIVVPGTILGQWEDEIKVLFKPKSFDILLYGTGKAVHDQFWAVDGPFYTSKHKPRNKIILASHSALQQDFSSIYMWGKPAAGNLPWADAQPLPAYNTRVGSTLYGQRYLSATIDEAHTFRNCGAKHSSVLHLLKQSSLRFIMTATPLQTSTKDIAGMGRLVGLPYFLSEEAFVEEKADSSNIRRAKTEAGCDVLEGDPTIGCQMVIAQRMQRQFEGRILRRTIDSKNWKGERIIQIPPYEEMMVIVKLTTREMEIITELADSVKESVSTSNSSLMIVSRTFYLEHRMSVCFARLNLQDPIPTFDTLEAWEAQKSTKFDLCARMCLHKLARDDAPEIIVNDGIVTFPELPLPLPGIVATHNNKIVVYAEFPSLGGLLRNIFDLYGVKNLYIDGQATFIQRAKVVKAFCEGNTHRVLIISSVGATGLNLSVASTIIFVDQPWSAQDERQIRGRCHRQPQKKVVKCYHILADETADIILSSLARGKKSMLDAFLEKDAGQDMYDLLTGKMLAKHQDDLDSSDPEVQEAKREEKAKRLKEKREEKREEEREEIKNEKAKRVAKALAKEQASEDLEGKKEKKKLSPEMVNDDIEMEDVSQSKEMPDEYMEIDKPQLGQPQSDSNQMQVDGAVDDEPFPPPDTEMGFDDRPDARPGTDTGGTDDDIPNVQLETDDTNNDNPAGTGDGGATTSKDFEPRDRSSSVDLSFLVARADVPTPPRIAGTRRGRSSLPDSPEVQKEKKRTRAAPTSRSSSIGEFDPEEFDEQDMKASSLDAFSDGSADFDDVPQQQARRLAPYISFRGRQAVPMNHVRTQAPPTFLPLPEPSAPRMLFTKRVPDTPTESAVQPMPPVSASRISSSAAKDPRLASLSVPATLKPTTKTANTITASAIKPRRKNTIAYQRGLSLDAANASLLARMSSLGPSEERTISNPNSPDICGGLLASANIHPLDSAVAGPSNLRLRQGIPLHRQPTIFGGQPKAVLSPIIPRKDTKNPLSYKSSKKKDK